MTFFRTLFGGCLPNFAFLLLLVGVHARAAEVHGVVTDASGAKVTNATLVLIQNGNAVGTSVSGADGSFQIITGTSGRFYLVISAKGFRQLETPGFYAGRLDNVQRNLVLELQWVHRSMVVTPNGVPTPQPQVGAATSVLGPSELSGREDLVSILRLMPGASVVQVGQMGARASVLLRGGGLDSNKVLVDGADAGDVGGGFDFGSLSTAALERAEVYRGPDSSLYGAGAESGVVSLSTPHGSTSFPSFLFHGDVGNLLTSQEDLAIAGALGKLDYLGEFDWLQTDNNLPLDEFHVATTAANFGYQPNGATQIRGVVHYDVSATGVPGPWQFYQVADNATRKDQNIFLSASVDNQTTEAFHNAVRYGLTRKREQNRLWSESGSGIFDQFGDSFGEPVTVTGANGYSVTGPALLDFAGAYPQDNQLVSDRDELIYQGDYTATPHLSAQAGFQFEDERGAKPGSTVYAPIERINYDYRAAVHGDFKTRFFYTLGGDLEHSSLIGTETSPRAGFSVYALKPRHGAFSGTRVLFNYGDGVREPSLTDQFYSLYNFLQNNGGQAAIEQLGIKPITSGATARTYEGGVEQAFLSQRLIFRTSFFHNEFGRQIEHVGVSLIPELLPGITVAQQNQLEQFLQANGASEQTVGTQASRALGVETTVEGGIGHSIFVRGGYTYLDAVVQRSFADSDAALLGPIPTYSGIPIGADSPLRGARPFQRPPHSGFITANYSTKQLTATLGAAFVSRSDDSDLLGGYDLNGGDSLLLPNRNLDPGFAKLDIGVSYQFRPWLGAYIQADNLTNNQHIAPTGYVSLPATIHAGIRIQWGKGNGH